MARPQIVWLRRDLRLADQAALAAAVAAGPVIPVYVLDDETPGERRMGGASRWWLHHSLAALDKALRKLGSRLVLRQGEASKVLVRLAVETGAGAIHALHHYEPWWRDAQDTVAKHCDLQLHHGNYLVPPGSILTGAEAPYRIFTPFWRALQEHMPPPLVSSAPARILAPEIWPQSDRLEDWDLLPRNPDWACGFRVDWRPGEEGAQSRLAGFFDRAGAYSDGRDLPAKELTSRLSPHFHFGEISPACVWHNLTQKGLFPESFLRQLAWRDYTQNLILQFPDYGEESARAIFQRFPWRDLRSSRARADFDAWKHGRTGYPIVDAGMRQLWASGWMHNRVRMIVASFLVKHLLIDWREGKHWFWDTLLDADYANNAANWQWVAGSGIDSNMFVRIMAPLSQSEKFDAGAYIRRWVPELKSLDNSEIHDPAQRPPAYPMRIIEHREARARALRAWEEAKTGG